MPARKSTFKLSTTEESLSQWLEQNGIPDRQTAWDLACVLAPLVERVIADNKRTVTR